MTCVVAVPKPMKTTPSLPVPLSFTVTPFARLSPRGKLSVDDAGVALPVDP